MISYFICALVIMAIVIVVLLQTIRSQQDTYMEHIENLMDDWNEERSELLDRIQAPTFTEYKQAEIKMVKAQKEEEPKPSFILE
jgi:predicted Holliday junction resolvase-like endonuclease